VPVNGLTFRVVGSQAGGAGFYLDVYVNHSLYQSTWFFTGTGSPGQILPPMLVNLSGIQHVTGLAIRSVSNNDYWYSSDHLLYYDDFTFTPELSVNITNSRVSGGLDQTTQNALLGADILLQATGSPTGGSYLWTLTGPVSVPDGMQNAAAIRLRSTDIGTITTRVTYTLNGVPASANVTIESVLPTLTSFTANQGRDFVEPPGACNSPDSFWYYRLGCIPPQDIAIHFTTAVHAPTFISDPAQSGIKYVQAVSAFRKSIARGPRCITIRSSDSNVESGWQRDAPDPYNPGSYPPYFFSQGNDLTMPTVDYPKQTLTFISAYEFVNALYVDDQFWMYVVYFSGDPSTPLIQRPIGRLRWNWGGLVVFDPIGSSFIHNLRYTNVPPMMRTGEPTVSMVQMQGVLSKADVPCPGGPPLTENHIDSSRVLIKYYYSDILGRSPDDGGWNWHTSPIAQCVFDLDCIVTRRSNEALGFFFSPEFIQNVSQIDPVMANPPGSPNFNAAAYNPRFIYWCYQSFLHRDPEQEGWDYWLNILNSTGDYGWVIHGFIYSPEYRSRLFF